MTAARVLKGQQVDNVEFGEEAKLYMESFSDAGYSKVKVYFFVFIIFLKKYNFLMRNC